MERKGQSSPLERWEKGHTNYLEIGGRKVEGESCRNLPSGRKEGDLSHRVVKRKKIFLPPSKSPPLAMGGGD